MASVYNVNQNNTYILSFDLVDEDGNAISLSALGTLLLTQYYYNSDLESSDKYHKDIINSRNNQDVKNANNVTVSSTGAVEWTLQQEDTVKLNPDTAEETHVCLFTWGWSGKQNSHEFFFNIRKIEYAV